MRVASDIGLNVLYGYYYYYYYTLLRHTAAINNKLECGPMPNLMVALPNIGGAVCSTLQSLADAHY